MDFSVTRLTPQKGYIILAILTSENSATKTHAEEEFVYFFLHPSEQSRLGVHLLSRFLLKFLPYISFYLSVYFYILLHKQRTFHPQELKLFDWLARITRDERREPSGDHEERGFIMNIMHEHATIAEQDLIRMLSRLCPVSIRITPHLQHDGSSVYAWQAGEASGTHPVLLGAVQAAVEAAMRSLASAPPAEETGWTEADFPLTFGQA
jgi:hypothetical protein